MISTYKIVPSLIIKVPADQVVGVSKVLVATTQSEQNTTHSTTVPHHSP